MRTPFPITDPDLALMGPHALWLGESLTEVATFRLGARVLDLGCGTALTSMFLAREFGVQVTAVTGAPARRRCWSRTREGTSGSLGSWR